MPPKLREYGERIATKLRLARRKARYHHRRFLRLNRKAQHANIVGRGADRKANRLRVQKPAGWRVRVAYQQAKARRAHGRAKRRSNRAKYQRRQRQKWNRKQEYLDELWNEYLKRKRKWQAEHPAPVQGGLETWGGKTVASGFSDILNKSKAKGWDGYVTSGFRSPAYSQQLCYSMCGAPSCPGRCAGAASNHSRYSVATGGAVDVTDYYEFGDIQDEIVVPIRVFNALGSRDPVHFSRSGR